MIEVKVPKEVREYEEKWLIGMTKRQLLGCFLAVIINVPIYMFLKQRIGSDLTGWIIIFTSAPFILLGFYKYEGMSFEKLLLCILNFYKTPQKRVYKTDNIYSYLKTEYEREENKNVTENKETRRKQEDKKKKQK